MQPFSVPSHPPVRWISGLLDDNHSATAANDSGVLGETTDDKPGPLVSLVYPLLMFATGVFGNGLALTLLCCSCRKHSRSVFYHLVAGLALTDLVGILATSPVTILVYRNKLQWVGGQALCDYFSFMMIWAGLATVLVVGGMTLERVLAILHPYFYERHVTATKVKVGLALIWLVSSLISCLPLLKVGSNIRHFPGTWCFFDFYSHAATDLVFSLSYAVLGLLVIALTALGNVAVMAVLLRMRRVSRNIGKSRSGRTLNNMTSEVHMIFFLAGIILVFGVCYSPLMIRVIINSVSGSQTPSDKGADLVAIRLASLNQILDPWVYLLFRRRLASRIYSCCKKVPIGHFQSSIRNLRSEYNGSFRNSPAGKTKIKNQVNGSCKVPELPLVDQVNGYGYQDRNHSPPRSPSPRQQAGSGAVAAQSLAGCQHVVESGPASSSGSQTAARADGQGAVLAQKEQIVNTAGTAAQKEDDTLLDQGDYDDHATFDLHHHHVHRRRHHQQQLEQEPLVEEHMPASLALAGQPLETSHGIVLCQIRLRPERCRRRPEQQSLQGQRAADLAEARHLLLEHEADASRGSFVPGGGGVSEAEPSSAAPDSDLAPRLLHEDLAPGSGPTGHADLVGRTLHRDSAGGEACKDCTSCGD